MHGVGLPEGSLLCLLTLNPTKRNPQNVESLQIRPLGHVPIPTCGYSSDTNAAFSNGDTQADGKWELYLYFTID